VADDAPPDLASEAGFELLHVRSPALRVPLPGGGAESGPWESVRWTEDGIPILLTDPDRYLERVGDDVSLPLDALSFPALAHLSRYLPQLVAPNTPMRRAIRGALERHLDGRVGLAVELGCSVGPDLRTLRMFAREVIGIDLSIAALRAARAQLDGEVVPLLARIEGRSFRSEDPICLLPMDGITVAVGNALDPPLFPGVADVVASVNVLDSVRSPVNLVGQMDSTLKPGGLLIIASPFCWADDFTPPEEALGGGTIEGFASLGTADALVELLSGRLPILSHLDYEILEQSDVPWSLRDHARSVTSYDVHVLVARKR
jgi:SAM-dependent methyltransferase